ncbi:hypothetical protein KIN20_033831 [Parelaphostrongylus tenuis]|uniref:RNA-dependent RNA polymerase n=1 Tax=Parelaphostrongylus tenuis TaxID=148309 RepID=A0AAD5WIJ7_PARTN|nr:hypothetical protein KIN20_033831 [Parelaphostrongylus tenuis]
MRKQQIQIPTDKGRTMFGVVDETGQLQYGQIFVQYTENINLKAPPPSALRRILTGKVLLTKNPCIVAGDVRVFNAVDIPELHHLCDVVVFPMHGPRPHPDEMAGSDLDGDEYAVIWDPELLLDRSEKPFNYTPEKPDVKPINKETMNADMIDFYVKYITQDSVGTISNSFLFQADLYGINSEVCQRLALKISQAVDFTKTGLPPAPLVREWSIDEDSGKEIPPEKSERRPDFHLGNDYDPTYRSPRLVGRIFREFKTVEDIVKISEDIDEEDEIECDKCLIVDGWSEYKEAAEARLAKYNGRLRSFMENYGVKTEGEIFSGCISEIRNRISDRDQDDMSLFNTTEVIEKKVTNLFREFREEFFEEFGGWQSCTQKIDARYAVGDNVFHRNSYRPTLKMRQKAVAYYRTCYERARVTRERMLSFAWIAYDVLAVVRRDNALEEEDIIHSSTPLHKMLKERVTDHCKINEAKLFSFTQFSNEEACCILQFYTRHYPGLNRLMFIICEWAERNRLFSVSLRRHHVCLILLLYATGQISGSSNRNRPLLDKVEDLRLSDSEPEKIVDDCQVELLVTFFEYLASRAFRKLRHISFSDLGYNSVLLCNQWKPLHEAAVRTYYNMAFNLKFDELNENQLTDPLRSVIIRECEPFVIEMPEDFDDSVVEKQIKLKTGVEEIRLRRLIYRGEGRVSVLARGTLASLRKLRNLLIIEPSTKTAIYGKEISAQLSRLTYENIIK